MSNVTGLPSSIGPYQILAKLGEGGMGEVYRARDTKLDRDVAIKLLPELFADDPERLARFEREAKTLASLNHPHIAQVYAIEGRAIVMELVEGEDLAERLKRGPIPVDEALAFAQQIAEALEAAHDAGIIHRDLKPANIKVRDDGTVKVLDFGLAKAVAQDLKTSGPHDLVNSPTITTPAMTMQGVILGTAAYMSPEQAKGRPVDRRADIWAFGCVLYEMLTAAFTIHVGDLQSGLSTPLLEADSWAQASAGFLLFARSGTLFAQPFDTRSFELSAAAVPVHDVVPDRPAFSASRNGVLAVRSADVSRPPSDLVWIDRRGATRGTLTKPLTGDYSNPALSPDGHRVAVNSFDARSGRIDIWLIDRARDVAERFTFGEGSSADPLWSPDGRQIAFLSERKGRLHVIAKAIDGSGEQLLEDVGPGTINFQGGSSVLLSDWSPDGKFIAYVYGPAAERTYRMLSVADRTSSPLSLAAARPYGLRFSRDGKWIAYSAQDAGRYEVFIRSFPALGRLHQISNGGAVHPRWGRNDREILYLSGNRVGVTKVSESGDDLIPGTPGFAWDGIVSPLLDSRNHFTVTPDGEGLLVRRAIGAAAPSAVRVLVNWPAVLQK